MSTISSTRPTRTTRSDFSARYTLYILKLKRVPDTSLRSFQLLLTPPNGPAEGPKNTGTRFRHNMDRLHHFRRTAFSVWRQVTACPWCAPLTVRLELNIVTSFKWNSGLSISTFHCTVHTSLQIPTNKWTFFITPLFIKRQIIIIRLCALLKCRHDLGNSRHNDEISLKCIELLRRSLFVLPSLPFPSLLSPLSGDPR